MKKIALISTFCDNDEKIEILKENIIKLKKLGIDTMCISPNFIKIPQEIIEISDYFFLTQENPILDWPVRAFTFWSMRDSVDGIVTMHRNVVDYGWAALYQVKKLSQIALSYDYDIFYHLIYDLEIDDEIEREILENECNIIHPRINPNNPNELWEATLHFMVFDKETIKKIADNINLQEYLSCDGVAEGQALKWSKIFNIKLSKIPVKDKIYYWKDYDFFDYSQNSKYKLFISKTEDTKILISNEIDNRERNLTSNLRMYFYDFIENQNFEIKINDLVTEFNINNNKMIEFPISAFSVKNIQIKDNDGIKDYSEIFNKISRNQIYFEK